MHQKEVLMDTDFHRYADDHEALAMLATLHKRGELRLVGMTTVTGNTWAGISARHARTAVASIGLDDISIYEGSGRPLLHRQSDFAHRSRLFGAAFGGAWGNADLLEKRPKSEPTGGSGKELHAVEFIVRTLRESPAPMTILSIGPLTNFAQAIRLDPHITQNVARFVVMGGAFYVPGNVTPSAEFNWWFDPEAAAIVLEEDIPVEVVPLDATDAVVLDHARFSKWREDYGDHVFFRSFHEPKFAEIFAHNPEFTMPVWDAIAAAYLVKPEIAGESADMWVSVDCSHGPSYGRVVAYGDADAFNLEPPKRPRARVVLDIHATSFWDTYESLVFSDENAN
jgi:inosine-uridine nucleoside N-ribohydrolase